ncbi:hypothetical protein LINPERHAP1_LOCUS30521 [Linum perenne]
MVVERSVGFTGVELEKMIRFDPIHEKDKGLSTLLANRQSTAAFTEKPLTGFEEASPKHEVAVKLQKVYKSSGLGGSCCEIYLQLFRFL